MNLTLDQKRIKVAEACGWIEIKWHNHFFSGISRTLAGVNPKTKCLQSISDYSTNLDAMREAEKVLNPIEQGLYLKRLARPHMLPNPDAQITVKALWETRHAEAAKCFDAFGLTLGLWTEE